MQTGSSQADFVYSRCNGMKLTFKLFSAMSQQHLEIWCTRQLIKYYAHNSQNKHQLFQFQLLIPTSTTSPQCSTFMSDRPKKFFSKYSVPIQPQSPPFLDSLTLFLWLAIEDLSTPQTHNLGLHTSIISASPSLAHQITFCRSPWHQLKTGKKPLGIRDTQQFNV